MTHYSLRYFSQWDVVNLPILSKKNRIEREFNISSQFGYTPKKSNLNTVLRPRFNKPLHSLFHFFNHLKNKKHGKKHESSNQ